MADKNETLRFVFETQGQEALDSVTEALAKAGERGGEAGEQIAAASEKLASLLEQAHQVEALQALEDRFASVTDKLTAAKSGLADLNAAFSETDKSSEAVVKQFESANKAVADLGAQHDALAVRISTARAALNAAGVDTRNLGDAHDALGKKAEESAAKLAESAAAANRFGGVRQVFDTVFESFKQGAETVGEFGKKLAEITGIAGVVASSLAFFTGFKFFEVGAEEAISLDKALAQLRATTGATGEQFTHLQETAEHAAESIGVTSTQAVQSMTRLASQFGSADAAAQALPATLTLAKIATLDFNDAANIVGETIKAFGLKASDAGKVVDELASIAQKTGASVGDLAHEMDQLAPLAKAAGVDFTTTAAAVAELASKGIDARNSTAALRELFTGLSQPTSKLRQDLVGMGIDTSSLATILQGLHDKGDLAQTALDSLSSKGRAGILALVQGGAPALQQFIDQLNGSAGSAKGLMDVLDNTFGGVVGDIKRDLGELAGSAVLGALDPLKDEIHKLDGEVKEFSKTDAFTKVKAAITDFASVAAKALDEFVHAVNWKDLGKQISDWMASAKESFTAVGDSVRTLGNLFGGIGDVVSGLWNVVKVVFTSIESMTSGLMAGISLQIGNLYNSLSSISDTAKQKAQEWYALAKQYSDNATAQWEAGDQAAERAVSSLKNLVGRIADAGDASAQAAPKHAENAKGLDATALAAENAIRATQGLPPLLADTSASLDHASDSARKAHGAILDLGTVTVTAKAAAADLEAAFSKLGVTSQAKLAEAADAAKKSFDVIDKSSAQTAAGLADRQNAFLAYAQKALAASASLDQGTKDSVQYALESKASALGILDALVRLEGEGPKAGQAIAGGMRGASEAMSDAAKQAQELQYWLDKLNGNGDGGGLPGAGARAEELEHAISGMQHVIDTSTSSVDRQRAAVEKARLEYQLAGGTAQALGQIMANTAAQFSAVSEAAGREFTTALDHALTSIGLVKEGTTDLTKSMGDLRNAVDTGSGIVSYFQALEAVQEKTQAKIDGQRESLAASISVLNSYGTAAQQNFGIAGQGAEKLLASLQAQRQALQDGNSGLDLLGSQELGPLQQALDGAIQRTQQLADAAKAAEQQYESLAQSIHDSLLQEQGNQSALEDERHQKQLADLKAAAEAANSLNSQSYQQAVQEENQLHELRMQNLQKQAQAASNASSSNGVGSSSASTSSSSNGGASFSQSSGSSGGGGTVSRIEITLNANNLGSVNLDDPRDQQRIMDVVMNGIRSAQRNAGH